MHSESGVRSPSPSSALRRVQAALSAAHASQEWINAFTLIQDERAVRFASNLGHNKSGPLTGVPVALKDLIDQEGVITTCGSAFYRETARRDAGVVARLEQAGAVIIGRTGLHEWAFGFNSENPHFGPVRNPWDPTTSTGGSSGGSAAVVAAGITPIAIGTDTGGSVRVPAALCGCFGLKTTHGRIPLDGVFPLVASIDTVGPLADSTANLELTYRVMARDEEPTPEPGHLRIGVPQPWVDDAPGRDDRVWSAFESALAHLRDGGHEVTTLDVPMLRPPGRILDAIALEVTEVHQGFRSAGEPYGEDVAERIDIAASVGVDAAAEAKEWQMTLRDEFSRVFESVDLLATPTTPALTKQIGESDIGEVHHRIVLSWFTALVNHALVPAIALPIEGTGQPPASLQLIGPVDSDLLLLATAAQLEQTGLIGFTLAPLSS